MAEQRQQQPPTNPTAVNPYSWEAYWEQVKNNPFGAFLNGFTGQNPYNRATSYGLAGFGGAGILSSLLGLPSWLPWLIGLGGGLYGYFTGNRGGAPQQRQQQTRQSVWHGGDPGAAPVTRDSVIDYNHQGDPIFAGRPDDPARFDSNPALMTDQSAVDSAEQEALLRDAERFEPDPNIPNE